MALMTSAFRCLLAFSALWSMSVLFSPPLFAQYLDEDPTASPAPNLSACTNENVKRTYDETNAFYKRVSEAKADQAKSRNKNRKNLKKPEQIPVSAVAKRFEKEVDVLWKRLPDCSTASNRGDLSHEAFVQYMDVVVREAYESAVLKIDAKKFLAAKFYITCYYRVQHGAHDEAQAEQWTSWIAFETASLPRVKAMRDRLCAMKWTYCPDQP